MDEHCGSLMATLTEQSKPAAWSRPPDRSAIGACAADDGSEPVEAGAMLEIVELRPWGAAMAQELPEMHDELNVADDDEQWSAIKQAATELAEIGLWEFVEATG